MSDLRFCPVPLFPPELLELIAQLRQDIDALTGVTAAQQKQVGRLPAPLVEENIPEGVGE